MPTTSALHPASLERLPGEAERPPLRLLETPRRLRRAAKHSPAATMWSAGWLRFLRLRPVWSRLV